MFGSNPRLQRVHASCNHHETYHMVPSVADHNFRQCSPLPQFVALCGGIIVGKQLKILSSTDYTLVVGLYSEDFTGAQVADTADQARGAIQVAWQAIEHARGIGLNRHANLKLIRH